jgi:hypothetical protein
VNNKKLVKQPGKDFNILQLTDLHLGGSFFSRRSDKVVCDAVRTLVKRVRPDLIAVTGDAFYCFPLFGGRNNLRACKLFCSLMAEFNTPWAFVFGNHETDVFTKYGKDVIAAYIEEQPNCFFVKGELDVHGCGNYTVPVYNEDGSVNNLLFFLDSHQKMPGINFHKYDYIRDCQVAWYEKTLKEVCEAEGRLVPSLMFFHIPFLQFKEAYEYITSPRSVKKRFKAFFKKPANGGKVQSFRSHARLHYGEIGEHFSVPDVKGKMFDKIIELDSTKGVFVGHDHLNTLSMTYFGVRLTYGLTLDHIAYMSYKKFFRTRGGTQITLNDEGEFAVRRVPLSLMGLR